ncbi:hypothetical protein [Sphingobacterium sp. UBA6645]|uniref:hypothetical protein n=1 Tax=Sphingobacterium sp. UBA6645 TaxID=1947511 RepID=UPI0025F1C966|nr:hypothetical protein [Sphingobacterium sp. UBA6645]
MKNLLLIASVLLSFISCKEETGIRHKATAVWMGELTQFDLEFEHAKIIDAIIEPDSIEFEFIREGVSHAYIVDSLEAYHLAEAIDENNGLIIGNILPLRKIIRLMGAEEQDSIGIVVQSALASTTRMPPWLKQKYPIMPKLSGDRNPKQYQGRYEFSLPILNKNKDRAVVRLDQHCIDCGMGWLFQLSKINNKWIVSEFHLNWMR